MIEKSLCEEVLGKALSTGADYAEIFAERSPATSLYMVDKRLEEISDSVNSGAGIRVMSGTRSVYGSTTDLSRAGLLLLAERVAEALGQGKGALSIHLTPMRVGCCSPVLRPSSEVSKKEKLEVLKRCYFAALEADGRIKQVKARILDVDRNILIANSEGKYIVDRQVRTRLACSSIAEDQNGMESGFEGPGRRMGMEMFEKEVSPEKTGREASRVALARLGASFCPAGQMTVAIENGFGGVIFHEACGHSLEATAVATGTSQMAGKLGQKIAGEKVTAIDDPTEKNAWGSIDVDDEGTPTHKIVLIEKGILKSYMVDRLGSRRMNGMPLTGSARRQDYSFEPTSRMTNTYIDNGPDRNEDIISSMESGLYCAKMGGGSVNPISGAFNFSVEEGYLVKNGRLTECVKGASLIGTGSEVLLNIDMVGQNRFNGQGMCGSVSGSVPNEVGQPLIRISSITVGGRN